MKAKANLNEIMEMKLNFRGEIEKVKSEIIQLSFDRDFGEFETEIEELERAEEKSVVAKKELLKELEEDL